MAGRDRQGGLGVGGTAGGHRRQGGEGRGKKGKWQWCVQLSCGASQRQNMT